MWAMMMDHNILIPLVSSLLMSILGPLILDVISVGEKIGRLLKIFTRFLAHDDSLIDDESAIILNDNPPPSQLLGGATICTSTGHRIDIRHDAATVMARLGLTWGRSGGEALDFQGCDTMDAVDELLDGKTANEAELKEAFYVFDRNEDGFICAAELWSVMRRLGFKEGARYDDCMRMIHAFDEDRDGRINYMEFRRMMENAV